MKTASRIFLGLFVFFVFETLLYWFWSHEPAGTTALALTSGLVFIIGFYLSFNARRLDAQPADDPGGEIADGAGEFGFYSPFSLWPLALGLSAATAAVGVAVGWWLFMLAVPLIIISVWGLVFEYYRGAFAH
ncbi:MAG: cytochrome c oxidase subunit 4 [Actinomycetes bacterium]